MGFELLVGDAAGIYYFVPPFAAACVLAFGLSRCRRLLVPLVMYGCLGCCAGCALSASAARHALA